MNEIDVPPITVTTPCIFPINEPDEAEEVI